MFVGSNRAVPKSTKMTIFIAILLSAYSSNGIGGTPINYARLNSPTIILLSGYCRGPIPVWMEKRIVPISVSSKILFL